MLCEYANKGENIWICDDKVVCMASHKVLGVVTRAVNYRDHDRILTLVTRERGKLTATARGCRKPQSKLLTAASPFCYGEYLSLIHI